METTTLIALGLGVGVVGFVLLRNRPPARPPVGAAPPAPSFGDNLLATIDQYTPVPVVAVGKAAAGAPPALQVALFPVGVTAVTYRLVTDPKGTAKSAYNSTLGRIF